MLELGNSALFTSPDFSDHDVHVSVNDPCSKPFTMSQCVMHFAKISYHCYRITISVAVLLQPTKRELKKASIKSDSPSTGRANASATTQWYFTLSGYDLAVQIYLKVQGKTAGEH